MRLKLLHSIWNCTFHIQYRKTFLHQIFYSAAEYINISLNFCNTNKTFFHNLSRMKKCSFSCMAQLIVGHIIWLHYFLSRLKHCWHKLSKWGIKIKLTHLFFSSYSCHVFEVMVCSAVLLHYQLTDNLFDSATWDKYDVHTHRLIPRSLISINSFLFSNTVSATLLHLSYQ